MTPRQEITFARQIISHADEMHTEYRIVSVPRRIRSPASTARVIGPIIIINEQGADLT